MENPEQEKVKSLSQDIRGAVKDGLIDSSTVVRQAIVSNLVKAEMDKREKAAISVFEKLEAAELDRRKVRPQFAGYNADGKPIGEPVFTKDQADQIKKTDELIAKLNGALEKALTSNDFSKVFELAGKPNADNKPA